jgi:hypothetical protein
VRNAILKIIAHNLGCQIDVTMWNGQVGYVRAAPIFSYVPSEDWRQSQAEVQVRGIIEFNAG